ncbi:MAG: flagellar hook-basal body complex protein FliE [Acidimicrobiia bacterium]
MAIAPISGGIAPISFDLLGKSGSIKKAAAGDTAESGTAFGKAISGAVDHLNALQNNTDQLAQKAVTGQLSNVEDYLTAATETQLTTQLTVAVRNRAVEAYQEIMRMAV